MFEAYFHLISFEEDEVENSTVSIVDVRLGEKELSLRAHP